MTRQLHVLILIVPLIILAAWVHPIQKFLDRDKTIQFVDKRPVFLPRGDVLKWLSMGYRGLMSDWLWINCVIYYGRRAIDEDNPYYIYAEEHGTLKEELDRVDHSQSPASVPESALIADENLRHLLYRFTSKGLVDYIYPMIDRVRTLDPHFIQPYIFGGVYVLLDTGEIDQAILLLEKGHRSNPDRWEFPLYLGWIYWMYRGDIKQTHEYLIEAVGKKDCPAFAGYLLRAFSLNMHQTEVTKIYLKGISENTENREIQERIDKLLAEFDAEKK